MSQGTEKRIYRRLFTLLTDREREQLLVKDWRAAAMRQWLRGRRSFGLLVCALLIPTALLIAPSPLAASVIGVLAALFCVPIVAVMLSLAGLDGGSGIGRLLELRTIPGGPREWVCALVFAARLCAVLIVAAWGSAAVFFTDPWRRTDVAAYFALMAFPAAWVVPYVAAAVRLWMRDSPLGFLTALTVALWPTFAYLVVGFGLHQPPARFFEDGMLGYAVVMGFQGFLAWFMTILELNRIAKSS